MMWSTAKDEIIAREVKRMSALGANPSRQRSQCTVPSPPVVKGGPLYPERALEWHEGQTLHYSKWEMGDVATADLLVLDHFAVCDHPGGPLLDPPGKKLCKVVADPSETWFLITCILPPFICRQCTILQPKWPRSRIWG
jgi:hypothetical protein